MFQQPTKKQAALEQKRRDYFLLKRSRKMTVAKIRMLHRRGGLVRATHAQQQEAL